MSGSISDKVDTIRKWIDETLDEIGKVPREMFRKILLYSVVDCFAQNWKGYPLHGSSKTFSEFLIEFAHEYRDMLCEVCPVTLYHDYKCQYAMKELRLPSSRILTVGDEFLRKEAERLLCCIEDANEREKAEKKHRYCSLMYAERNKLVHELNTIGMPIQLSNEQLPNMAQRIDGIWMLNIPDVFIGNVLLDAVGGYLEYCVQNNINPYENNPLDRTSRYAWYDK